MTYRDKAKQLQYQKDWYYKNKERHIKNVRKNEARYTEWARNFVISYLSEHPCIDCGEADIVVLDFDHIQGKKSKNVSDMLHNNNSLNKIKEEVEKCVVRCANCHRRKTVREGNFYKMHL